MLRVFGVRVLVGPVTRSLGEDEAVFNLTLGNHIEVRQLATEFSPPKVRVTVGVVHEDRIEWHSHFV